MECMMDKTDDFIVIYTTFPDQMTAEKIIDGLVRNRLAACGNIFQTVSIYTWKDKIEKASEYGAIIKTSRHNYKKVENYIIKNHPYEVPEIISWPIEKGLKLYLDWIAKESDGVSV